MNNWHNNWTTQDEMRFLDDLKSMTQNRLDSIRASVGLPPISLNQMWATYKASIRKRTWGYPVDVLKLEWAVDRIAAAQQ